MKLLAIVLQTLFLLPQALAETVPGAVNGTTSHYAKIRGQTYHYLQKHPRPNSPNIAPKGNIVLLHGIPDFSYGWRHQIDFLSSLGYRVIAPDTLGAARTDAPCEIARYTLKELSADIAALIDHVLGPDAQVILGGHDAGVGTVFKLPMWYPQKVKATFALSFPYTQGYFGPNTEWVDLEQLVHNGTFPTFGYQLQWRDVSFDRNFTTKKEIRGFLDAVVGGTTKDGGYALTAEDGILYDVLPDVVPESGFLRGKEMDLYVDTIYRHGVRGHWNFYRTRRMNFEDELGIAKAGGYRYTIPSLFIPNLNDISVIPEYYEEYMRASFDKLDIKPTNTSHWVLLEDPNGVNEILREWLQNLD